jgi:hypothetical protein
MASMTLLAAILEFSGCQGPALEDAPWKIVSAGLWYFAGMALANVIYSAAPAIESRLRPERVAGFRKWAFGLDLGISMAAPFVVVAVVVAGCPK